MRNKQISLLTLPSFLEEAANLQKDTKSKLVRVLWMLSEDFRHPSLQCKKIQGALREVYECRVDQDFRLIYDIFNNMLRCWYVGKHDVAINFGKRLDTAEYISVDDIEIGDASLAFVRDYIQREISPMKTVQISIPDLMKQLTF